MAGGLRRGACLAPAFMLSFSGAVMSMPVLWFATSRRALLHLLRILMTASVFFGIVNGIIVLSLLPKLPDHPLAPLEHGESPSARSPCVPHLSLPPPTAWC
ncbi:MAG: hypothetical protein P8076_10835 [Gammaproteobacteria bacterium]